MIRVMRVVLIAAVASTLLGETLGAESPARNLLTASWLLAPYLVLVAVMVIAEKRTSFLAMAIATLLGAVGGLTPALMMTFLDADVAARLVPMAQAAVIAVLLPACKWIVAGAEAGPPVG